MVVAVLAVDSYEYDLLAGATVAVADVPGLTCEIGVRSGGGSQIIMAASPKDRVHIAVDPWGQLPYYYCDNGESGWVPFTNKLRRRCYAELYVWAAFENRDLIMLTLEDTEFFARYGDGVPVYRSGDKRIVNEYALVHLDGQHTQETVACQAAFFGPRSPLGARWVFDDWPEYALPDVGRWGFVEEVRGDRKAVFHRVWGSAGKVPGSAEKMGEP